MDDSHTWKLELPPAQSAPRAARMALVERLPELPEEVSSDLQLLVSELVTNALVHGEMAPSERIVLTVARKNGEVRVEVCDPGGGEGVPATSESPGLAGGYGLRIVDNLASRWGVRMNERRCVWFSLELAR